MRAATNGVQLPKAGIYFSPDGAVARAQVMKSKYVRILIMP